jgi:hypothetical protein
MKAVLLILGVVLGGVLYLQWLEWPPPAPRPPPAATAETPTATAPAVAPPTLPPTPTFEEYASVVERPLFLPDRRPPPEEPDEAPEEEGPEEQTALDGMNLTAVIIAPTEVSALVVTPGSKELARLRIGDDFEGWTVTGIEPDKVLLERQGESDELILRDFTKAPTPIPPTPRPAAGRRPSRQETRRPDGRPTPLRADRKPTPSRPGRATRQPTRTGVPSRPRPDDRQPPRRTNASPPSRQRTEEP